MAYKNYSDIEVTEHLIKLAINKYDFDLTEKDTGISKSTLRRWAKDGTKKTVPELLERAIERLLMHIPENMAAKDWAISLGILLDKWLLGQGLATSRNENIMSFLDKLPEDQRDKIIEESERILTERASGSPDISNKQKR